MSGARLKHYRWGREGEGMTAAEQAIAIGLSEARKKRAKVPKKRPRK